MKKAIVIFAAALFAALMSGCANMQVTVSESVESSANETAKETAAAEESAAETVAVEAESAEPISESAKEAVSDETETETPSMDIIPESYAYSLIVAINPTVELYFDKNDVINGVAFLNDDAVNAYKDLELVGASLKDGMELIIARAESEGYLKENGDVQVELSKIGTVEKEMDTSVIVNAVETVEAILTADNGETGISVNASVNNEVTEQTGLTAPEACPTCSGTGKSCSECGGTGIVNCKRCDNGIESCGTCHGTAVISCHGCHGAGTVGDLGETCNRCGGTGEQSCDACHGQGTFLCSWCKGELKHVCPECWGECDCPDCSGTGWK